MKAEQIRAALMDPVVQDALTALREGAEMSPAQGAALVVCVLASVLRAAPNYAEQIDALASIMMLATDFAKFTDQREQAEEAGP